MKETLRFITCGSVDDGKSTLIGRLLWDSKLVFEDQVSALAKDSTRWGTQGDQIDYALLLDGLQAEREQGITIDVAYRFFATPNRRFIVADTPGHEQYTRNMATGASTCDLAVLVVHAKKGLLVQTHRHARIVSLLGIRHLVMAVNKMDLVDWSEEIFTAIENEFKPLAKELGFETFQAIPLSALNGGNVIERSQVTPWYKGPALLPYLENIDVSRHEGDQSFAMAVQYVNRPNQDFRGYCGRIASGVVRPGDRVRVAPGGTETTVKSIVVWQDELPEARTEQSVTLCLEDEVDVTRGCIISAAAAPIPQSDQFEAHLLGLSENPLIPGRSYLLKLHTSQAIATVTAIKYVIDVKSGHHLASKRIEMNDIGVVNISTDRLLAFENYTKNRRLGSFILVDRHTNQTVGAGMIDFSLRRADNIHWQAFKLDKAARAQQNLQSPACIWFTGLSGSGKSTIANMLEQRLFAAGKHTYLLDGDNIRHGLNRDLGFTESDRVENLRRTAEVAHLLVDAGLIVIVSLISPFRSERELARSRFAPGEFMEVFVDTPIEECERRDVKGLYAKARRGELINFTGVDSPYEAPEDPEVHLETTKESSATSVERILEKLKAGGAW